MYNLTKYGLKLKEIRILKGFTQSEVCSKAEIDIRTISRLENGLALPKLVTLELLSNVYYEDLVSLLLEYRFDEYELFYSIENKILFILNNEDFSGLKQEIEKLDKIMKDTDNSFLRVKIEQFISLLNGIILIKEKSYKEARIILVDSLQLTIKGFSLSKYERFFYNPQEIHILTNIAHALYKENNLNGYKEILIFCEKFIRDNHFLYTRICVNLSNAYKRTEDYTKGLEVINKGLDSAIKNNNYNDMDLLYYTKGIMEYYLKIDNYENSFINAINFCIITKRYNIKKTIEKKLKDFHSLEYDL